MEKILNIFVPRVAQLIEFRCDRRKSRRFAALHQAVRAWCVN
jgi:hypothetical protein